MPKKEATRITSPTTSTHTGSSSRDQLARTVPDESLNITRSRHLERDDNNLFKRPHNIGPQDNINIDHNHTTNINTNNNNNNRHTSPDELYEIASVFKPVPGYEKPWEMAPPRYWGQLRRLFLEESISRAESHHDDRPSASSSYMSSLMRSDHSPSSSAKHNAKSDLNTTSCITGSSMGSSSLSRASSSVHGDGSTSAGSGAPNSSPSWEPGPPKHWLCLSNLRRDTNTNLTTDHHYHRNLDNSDNTSFKCHSSTSSSIKDGGHHQSKFGQNRN